MDKLQTDVIAFAHHADDQVETAIMRMSQGSGSRGLAAMRPVRRWGMGKKDNEYFAFGADGMRKWIVRPLLHVSKDRLLATCEANKLEYIHDPTNFQPDLTFRNRIRQTLLLK
ncbi:PP-loop, partial [Trametes sanguinea]